MAKVPNRDQFYSSKRTGKTARRTGGEVVEITFQIPAGRVVEVVKDTCPIQWRVHDEVEYGFPDALPNKQLGQLLVHVVDAIDEETRHATPVVLPVTEPEAEAGGLPYVYNSETFIEFAQAHGYTGPIDADDEEVDEYLETLGITCANTNVDGKWTWLYTRKADPVSHARSNSIIAQHYDELETPTVEAAPPVSPSEFDPCPELSDAERPSGVLTHTLELEEAHQERAKLLKKIEDITHQRDAARAEAKRHASVISSTVDERKEERARLDNLIKADEDRAFHQRQKIEATRGGEVAALLITELTGILCTKEMDGDERELVWKEFYRRLTVQTEDYPTRLTTAVRDIAHKLFRSAIKQG